MSVRLNRFADLGYLDSMPADALAEALDDVIADQIAASMRRQARDAGRKAARKARRELDTDDAPSSAACRGEAIPDPLAAQRERLAEIEEQIDRLTKRRDRGGDALAGRLIARLERERASIIPRCTG